MPNPPTKQQVKALLLAALECSFYVAPEEPGLTNDELTEVGRRLNLQPGEMSDALLEVADVYMGMHDAERLLPSKTGSLIHWQYFIQKEEPEYRDIAAFDYVYLALRDSARASGIGNVRLERKMLVERAIRDGISKNSILAAIAILIFTEVLQDTNGILQPITLAGDIAIPSENFRKNNIPQTRRDPARAAAYPIVQDVIGRRHDGRLPMAEPLDAFAGELDKLGYGQFRLWWQQFVSELRVLDAQTSPVAVLTTAAALVEGALTFVVQHARTLNLGVMGSKTFEGSPTSWRIDDLVGGASGGKDAAILNTLTRNRADHLVKARQRIHAGRMLSDFPGGPPDLRPEEARDAKATAELVVRCVLDWLRKYQP